MAKKRRVAKKRSVAKKRHSIKMGNSFVILAALAVIIFILAAVNFDSDDFIALASGGKAPSTCSDPDGSNFNVKGTCTYGSKSYTDYCTGGTVTEYFCKVKGNGCDMVSQACANGCVNGACCTPTTCAAQGKTCGTISDGCGGTLNCGTCTANKTCTNNVCACPTTCASEGKTCGTISDKCGGTLNCGTCPTGQACSGGTCIVSDCSDSDGSSNFNIKGTCADKRGITFNDYCNGGTQPIVDNYCSGSTCMEATRGGNCLDGALVTTLPPSTHCTDSDGSSYTTKGTCTDDTGITYTDFCDAYGTARDYYCQLTSGPSGTDTRCMAGGMKPGSGSCVDGAWVYPNVCGDGQIAGTEQCDGTNLGGQTCITKGFTGGTLSCTSSCTFDTSQCVYVPPPNSS